MTQQAQAEALQISAWLRKSNEEAMAWRLDAADAIERLHARVQELEAAQAAPGWKLVPDADNMTDEQAEAIAELARVCGGGALDIYRAALEAAPTPQQANSAEFDGIKPTPPALERKPLTDEQTDELGQSVFGWTSLSTVSLVRTTEAFLAGKLQSIPTPGAALLALEDAGIPVLSLELTKRAHGIGA